MPRKNRTRLTRLALLLALALPAPAFAQAGELDTTFSGDSKVVTNTTSGYDYAVDVAIQPSDGKIVAAGVASGLGGRVAVLRYDADGTLDTSFSGDGKVFTNLTRGDDGAYGIDVQPDGKIVVAGNAGGRGGRFALLRYNPDGTLDPSFSGDGIAITNFSPGNDFAFGLVIQPDGGIVAAGRAGGQGGMIAVARYLPDGTLDPSFSSDGRVATNLTSGEDYADHAALQADGSIVVAGTANYYRRNARFALARYLPNGTLDPSFSGDGLVTTNFTPGLDYGEELELQGDGKIVVGGTANYYGRNARFALARYVTDGTLDPSFSGDGLVTTNFTPGFDGAFGLAIQPTDGKIVAAGFASGQGGRFALARYLAN